jgi:hypothetical protein
MTDAKDWTFKIRLMSRCSYMQTVFAMQVCML